MISLYLDIFYFSQLRRINQASMDGMVARLSQILLNANGQIHGRSSPFLFTFDEEIPGIRLQAAQASFVVYSELKAASDELSGFVLALDENEETNPEILLRSFKKTVFSLQADNNFVVGEALADDFSDYFSYDRRDDFCFAIDFRFTHPVSADEQQIFWERPSASRLMLDRLDPVFRGESLEKVLVFTADRQSSPMRVLERAIKPLTGAVQVPRFRPKPGTLNPYAPICACLPVSDIPVSGGRLTKSERRCYDAARPAFDYLAKAPFMENPPAEIERRFFLFFELYLHGFVRDRIARGLPPLILLEDVDLFPVKSIKLFSSFIQELTDGQSLVLVATSESPECPSLDPEWTEYLELPEASEAEAIAYVDEVFEKGKAEGDRLPRETVETISEKWKGEPLAFFHALLSGSASKDPTAAYLASLPTDLLEILFFILISNGVLATPELEEFLTRTGRKAQSQQLAFRQLYQMGFIVSQENPEPSADRLSGYLPGILGQEHAELEKAFCSYVAGLADRGALSESIDLSRHISGLGFPIPPASVLRTLSREYSLGNVAAIKASRESGFFQGLSGVSVQDRLGLDRWAGLLAAAAGGSENELRAMAESMDALPSDEDSLLSGQRSMSRFLKDYSGNRSKDALDRAKRALISFQRKTDILGEAQANRALGLCFLKSEQIYDAMDYFANAFAIAEAIPDDFECALDSYYEALSYFLHGNYSRCARLAARCQDLARKGFRPDWEIQALFLQARVEFEFGRFDKALEFLSGAMAVDRLRAASGCADRLRIWSGRCLTRIFEYSHAAALLEAYPDDAEALAFLAENLLEIDEPEKALAVAEKALEIEPSRRPVSPDQPRLASGYDFIEDRAIGSDGSESAFTLFLLTTRAEIKRRLGKQEEAANELYRLTRELKLSENDPNLHVYLYHYFLAIPESGSVKAEYSTFQTDRATILSKAFKTLQLRASRIDTAVDKNSYMTANRSNRMLMDSAKLYKFI
jgi:tetratricopeptide (TPR) repeat protein